MGNTEVYTGEVIWFNAKKGFGFISWKKDSEQQKDMFVYYSDIAMQGFKQLKTGQLVEFSIGKNNHDQDKAINVITK